jgi:hypothetical protein
MTKTRTGLLIIRAWIAPGSSSSLRVQIRFTTDVSLGVERSETSAEVDTVVDVVRAWLLEMAATEP